MISVTIGPFPTPEAMNEWLAQCPEFPKKRGPGRPKGSVSQKTRDKVTGPAETKKAEVKKATTKKAAKKATTKAADKAQEIVVTKEDVQAACNEFVAHGGQVSDLGAVLKDLNADSFKLLEEAEYPKALAAVQALTQSRLAGDVAE